MDPERAPTGHLDIGDDAYGDSILEAARHVLDTCVRETNRGGWAQRFSELWIPAIALIAIDQFARHPCHCMKRSDSLLCRLRSTDQAATLPRHHQPTRHHIQQLRKQATNYYLRQRGAIPTLGPALQGQGQTCTLRTSNE